jgi:hypothetical protein
MRSAATKEASKTRLKLNAAIAKAADATFAITDIYGSLVAQTAIAEKSRQASA